jgi:predicted DCC family thiol-disulfide oxidoreductase YuxK
MNRQYDRSSAAARSLEPPKRVRVLYDGECAMCSNLALHIRTGAAHERFSTENLHDVTLPDGVSRRAVERELHVIEVDGTITRGPEAVFRLLEEYPRWRWLAQLGRLRAMRPFARLGYRFVALNRDNIFGAAARIFWAKEIALVALLAGLALSPRLWTSRRAYPLAPVIDINAPTGLEWLPAAGLVAAAAAALVLPRPRTALLMVLSMALWLALGDQTRWQPWFYQYCAVTALMAVWNWQPLELGPVTANRRDETIGALRAIIVGTYFWSGLQKVNASYLEGATGWLLEPLRGLLPGTAVDALASLAMGVPATEVAIGLGLLWPRTRQTAVIAAVFMHVLILALLGPWGHDWNSVVWPWQAAMIALVAGLFAGDRRTSARAILGPPMSPARALAVGAFCIMPALGVVGLWDAYLSASLYARNLPDAAIVVTDDSRDSLPDEMRPYVDDDGVLWPMSWALAEMNVPAYPAPRVYKALARAVCRATADPDGVTLRLGSRPGIFTGEIDVRRYGCEDL